MQRYRGELAVLGGRDSGGGAPMGMDNDYSQAPQLRQQVILPEPPIASGSDLDDDIPF